MRGATARDGRALAVAPVLGGGAAAQGAVGLQRRSAAGSSSEGGRTRSDAPFNNQTQKLSDPPGAEGR